MIRFFRSLRQELLTKNKISKYLLYALGEIALVVIGILIALSIDNYNEREKQKEYLNSIYRVIQEDLRNNIAQASDFINDYEHVRKPAFDTILSSRLTRQRFEQDDKYYWVFGGYDDIRINTRGYDLFKNQASSSLVNDTLASIIFKFYGEHLAEIDVAQLELQMEFKDNGKAFKNYDWVTDHFLRGDSEGYFEYLTKNPEAIRRLASYKLYYSIYVSELNSFKDEGKKLIYKIDQRLGKKD